MVRKCAFRPSIPIFLLLLLFLSSSCSPASPVSPVDPVEPVVTGLENAGEDMFVRGRFSVVDPEMNIYALDISSSGDDILFSSDARSIHMLDDQGRLKWEVVFEGLPVAAELSDSGYYIAVGTDCGEVYFLHRDSQVIWKKNFPGAICHIALSPYSNFLVISVKDENDVYKLYALDQWGTPLWERETGPLLQLDYVSERNIVYCSLEKEGKNVFVVFKNGEVFWEKEAAVSAVSKDGEFAAIYNDNVLSLYNLKTEKGTSPGLFWRHPLSSKITSLELTEAGEHVLAYSAFPGAGNNLFVFCRKGSLSWEKKIPSGSLLQASRFGDRIVASSWQEYSEDFSKVLVLNKNGDVLQETGMASRIEKISLSRDGNILALAGNEGNIFILDMPVYGLLQETELSGGSAPEHAEELYRPVVFSCADEEQYITLYFYDEYALRLVPVSRCIKSTQAPLQAAVSELIKGPCRQSGLSRTIPKDTHIKVTLQDGIAVLDLPEDLSRLGDSKQNRGIIDSLILTASQFPSVEGVRFLIEGSSARIFGMEGVIINDVFPSRSPVKNKTMLYIPYRSGKRFFLLPREAIQLGSRFNTAQDLLKILLEESRRFLPVAPELKDIRITNKEIILDWGQSLAKLFPPEGSPEEKALASLFLDSVLLTLGSNFQQDRVVLFIEGEPWEPPEGYPSTVLEYSEPFYLNPE